MRTICLCLLFSLQAFAGSAAARKAVSKQVEAAGVITGVIEGSVTPNVAVNRIKYLGEENFAAHELGNWFAKEPDIAKRRMVIQTIAGLTSREGHDPLVAGLADADGAVRMYAAQGLGRLKARDAGPALVPLLGDETMGVRREVARALGLLAEPKFGASLSKAAKLEDDPETRAAMLLGVGQSSDRKQIPTLEAFLASSSESTRFAAAAGLCVIGAPSGQKFATALLASKDRYQRMQGLMLFEGSRAKEAAPTVEPLLKDPDKQLQAAAARILYQGGDKAKLDWLVLHSFQALGEDRLPYEKELEALRLTDDDRRAILRKAGIK